MSVAEKSVNAEISPEEIEQLAKKLSWPNEETTEEALRLVREIMRGAIVRIRVTLAELREISDSLPQPETTVVPKNLDTLKPGSFIELLGVDPTGSIDDSHTHPLWYILDTMTDIAEHIEMQLRELECSTEDAERITARGVRALLREISPELFRQIAKQVETANPADFSMPSILEH